MSMTERVYPDELTDLDIWVCWARDHKGRKRPRAPWLDGHAYPVSWGSGSEPRPEADFEKALKWSTLRPFEIDAMGVDFEPDIPEESLDPGLILPHDVDGVDRRLMQVDLDDVRREDGSLHPEAERILEEVDAYASVSVSGDGVHALIWARLPAGMGKFIGELDDEPFVGDSCPQLELYDHGRHVALTGEHLEGTPLEIPERPELVDEWIERYEDATDDGEDDDGSDRLSKPAPTSTTSGSGKSPYYEHPVLDFAPPKANLEDRSTEAQGAHPVHGGTSSADSASSNYNVDKSDNLWSCFAHDSGGGPLKMVAVMEGKLRCDDCEAGALGRLDDGDFLEVCLAARDRGFDGSPPYRALVELARREGLALKDPDEGVLGRSCYSVAEQIFKNY